MKKLTAKKIISFGLVFALAATLFPASSRVTAKTDITRDEYDRLVETYNIGDAVKSYNQYSAEHASAKRPSAEIRVTADNLVRYEEDNGETAPEYYENFDGRTGRSVLTGEDSLVEFEVEVGQTGMYNMSVIYYPVKGKSSDIQRSIFIDGELPFKEFSIVTFPRIWESRVDDTYVNENGVFDVRQEYVDIKGFL
ncbi:MAG: hypothetical protein J6X60_08250 [Ruminiclostridium sp.]|nr:hypothetical protein [Ruminiclostridium sp.]